MSTITHEVRANLTGDTLQDLDSILSAAQAARLDTQLVDEWEQRQHDSETLLERFNRLRLNPHWLIGYIAGAQPAALAAVLDEVETIELPTWAVRP